MNPFDVTKIRQFSSGATRDVDDHKYDYEGFYSPLVMERFGEYMHKNRKMKDGSVRDSDNWTKGITLSAYMKSLIRHVIEAWKAHRGFSVKESLEDSLCAVLFNTQGYLYELLKTRNANLEIQGIIGRGQSLDSYCLEKDTLTPEEEAAWNDSQAKNIPVDCRCTETDTCLNCLDGKTPSTFWGV